MALSGCRWSTPMLSSAARHRLWVHDHSVEPGTHGPTQQGFAAIICHQQQREEGSNVRFCAEAKLLFVCAAQVLSVCGWRTAAE